MSNYIKDLEFIQDIMAEKDLCYWKVEGLGAGANRYGMNDEKCSPDEAFLKLQKVIKKLTGVVCITVQKREFHINGGDLKTDVYKYRYNCSDNDEAEINGLKPQTNNGMPSVYELMQTNFKLQMELELNKIKQELSPETVDKEAEKQKLMMQTAMFNRIMQVFDGKPAIAAPGTINNNTSAPDAPQPKPATAGGGHAAENPEGKKVVDSIRRLKNIDADIAERLEMLATIAETKPEVYQTAINMLKDF